VENDINIHFHTKEVAKIPFRNVFIDILKLIRNSAEDLVPQDHCLLKFCKKNVANTTLDDCPQLPAYEAYKDSIPSNVPYEDYVLNRTIQLSNYSFGIYLYNSSYIDYLSDDHLSKTPTCFELVKDYFFFKQISSFFPKPVKEKDVKPGSLLRFLFVQLEDKKLRTKMYHKYLDNYSKAWSWSLGHEIAENMPLPDLIHVLEAADEHHDDDTNGLQFNVKLLRAFIQSHHPPHVFDHFENVHHGDSLQLVSAPTFPFCWYYNENVTNSGVEFGPYGDRYCDNFQPTFNEYGLCYTYNNEDLHTNGIYSDKGGDITNLNGNGGNAFNVRKIEGCGKEKGFRLIIDANEMSTRGRHEHGSNGYFIFITNPGSVTQKVHFHIHPSYVGEYFFYMHSTNLVRASPEFKDWNENKKVLLDQSEATVLMFS
jgi:hypothetical protein